MVIWIFVLGFAKYIGIRGFSPEQKEDAGKYLSDYTIKTVYLPVDAKVRAFVEYYYAQYRLMTAGVAEIIAT